MPRSSMTGVAFLAMCWIIISSGCGNGEGGTPDPSSLTVAVSILPQKHFVEAVAGDSVEIVVIVPPGASPAAYEPSPSDMRNLSRASIWFTVGVGFEAAWIPRITGANPDLKVIPTYSGIARLPIDRYSVEGHFEHSHDHQHDPEGLDPHIWLSPELVRTQVQTVAQSLASMDSGRSREYMAALERFQSSIDTLQRELHDLLDPLESRSFMVFHPAWGYFADEFQLVQVPVESGGSEPSPGEMSVLVDFALGNSISVIFVSPQFSTSSAETIAEQTAAEVAYIDPLAENWRENLMTVAEKIAGASE